MPQFGAPNALERTVPSNCIWMKQLRSSPDRPANCFCVSTQPCEMQGSHPKYPSDDPSGMARISEGGEGTDIIKGEGMALISEGKG